MGHVGSSLTRQDFTYQTVHTCSHTKQQQNAVNSEYIW